MTPDILGIIIVLALVFGPVLLAVAWKRIKRRVGGLGKP